MSQKKFSTFLIFLFSVLSAAVLTMVIDSLSVREQYKKIEPNLDNYSMAEMLYLSLEKAKNSLLVDEHFEIQRKVFLGRLLIIENRTKDDGSYRADTDFSSALINIKQKVEEGDALFVKFNNKQLSKSEMLDYLNELEQYVIDLQEAIFNIQVKNFKNVQLFIKNNELKLDFLAFISIFCIVSLAFLVKKYSAAMESILRKKNIFISSIYHELAGSTQAIAMAVDILKEENAQECLNEEIYLIGFHCDKIFEQTKEIMEYSRFEIGDVKVKYEPTNLRMLINEASECISWKNNKLRMYCSTVDAKFHIDHYKLSRIIINLLDNSNKFTSNGIVVIHARYKAGYIYIRVKDNGVGFDMNKINMLYQPFKFGSEKNTKQGLGLGLAIIKSNVDVMRGMMRVRSSKGEGTIFFLRLPGSLSEE